MDKEEEEECLQHTCGVSKPWSCSLLTNEVFIQSAKVTTFITNFLSG